MFAAQAAANLLGIHRSTLYLAVRRMKLIPDAYTPGGHARFRRETLERFSDRLALDSATGGDGSMSRAVASAVASLSHFTGLQPVCEAVVEAALAACPGFESCLAVARYDDCQPRDELRLLASRGLQKRLATEYLWLRRRPGLEFISTNVVRQNARFLCSDVLAASATVPDGGLKALTSAGYRCCAVLPCVSDGLTLGMLICLGSSPCSLSEPELVALGNLADVLTVALRRARRDEATQRQTEAIGELMRQTHAVHGDETRADDLYTLRRICQRGARARLVREWGIAPTDMESPAPLADLLRAAAAADAPQRIEWAEDDGGRIALAIPAQAWDRRAAVGAIWRRRDVCTGMELALLQVYAQACSAVASR
jgi:excisionase family DNA binding protein